MSSRQIKSEDKEKKKDAFSNFATNLLDAENEDKEAKQQILRDGVEKREKKMKTSLGRSKLLNEQLSKIRVEAGLSAFIGTSGKIKSPKFRRKEFQKLLARELLLIGRDELIDKGGITSMKKLQSYFAETRENWILREDDISEGLSVLLKAELIPKVEKINNELEIIYFIPSELSQDMKQILDASIGIDITFDKLEKILNWDKMRVKSGINQMVNDGLVIVDGENIYFPNL